MNQIFPQFTSKVMWKAGYLICILTGIKIPKHFFHCSQKEQRFPPECSTIRSEYWDFINPHRVYVMGQGI